VAAPALNPAQLSPRTSTSPPAILRRALELWHLTSLDAPSVAITWTLAFAAAAQIHLPWQPVLAIALAAWSVYILDRIFDARKEIWSPQVSLLRPGSGSLRPRHFFHWNHRGILLPLATASALAAIFLFGQSMLPSARPRNALLALAALGYFAAIHNPWRPANPRSRISSLGMRKHGLPRTGLHKVRPPKELLVGILFTLACAAPTWARTNPAQQPQLILPILALIALAWLNCHAIEAWESAAPPRIAIRRLALPLAGLILLSAGVSANSPRRLALFLCAAVSAAALAALDRTRRQIPPTLLRAGADLVLLTPLAIVYLFR
jgi:hypothetical protein